MGLSGQTRERGDNILKKLAVLIQIELNIDVKSEVVLGACMDLLLCNPKQ